MPENKAEKFNLFTRWLSDRLNLPADAVVKTVRVIPEDERQGIRTLKQWRPLIEKFR